MEIPYVVTPVAPQRVSNFSQENFFILDPVREIPAPAHEIFF